MSGAFLKMFFFKPPGEQSNAIEIYNLSEQHYSGSFYCTYWIELEVLDKNFSFAFLIVSISGKYVFFFLFLFQKLARRYFKNYTCAYICAKIARFVLDRILTFCKSRRKEPSTMALNGSTVLDDSEQDVAFVFTPYEPVSTVVFKLL